MKLGLRWWRALRKSTLFRSPLTWVMILITLACVVWLRSYYEGSNRKPELRFEFAKAALEIGVISMAGTFVSLFVSAYERRLAHQRYREDFLKEVMKRVTASYNKSKGARRIARAKGLVPADEPAAVRLEAYDCCMEVVNDAQLELEAVKKDLETSKGFFPEDSAIYYQVKSMEHYLGDLVSEYEDVRSNPEEGAAELSLTEAENFRAFVAKDHDDEDDADEKITAFSEYARDHRHVRKAINDHLLGLT